MRLKPILSEYYDSNVYVINEKVLVDSGMNPDYVFYNLEQIMPIENIELIILTHAHYDHSGGAAQLIKKSNAKLAIHKGDAVTVRSTQASRASNFGEITKCPQPDIMLEGGEKISIGPNENGEEEFLEVIHTPGHTAGCICLYEKNSKTLFSGDTIFSDGGIGRSNFEESIPEKMTESIKKLTELEIENLYPGHGSPTIENAGRSVELSYKMSSQMNP
jgi:Zn-dependent hydrolases, including glyoxylases